MRKIIALSLICLIGCSAISAAIDAVISGCSGFTYAQIILQDSVSVECRDGVQSLLPDAENNLPGKLVPLGSEVDSITDQPTVYLFGMDLSSESLDYSDFSDATVTVTANGSETVLDESEYAVEAVSDSSGDLAGISIVIDYSASMRDGDIDDVAGIFADFIDILPTVYEAEVIAFSDDNTQIVSFSEDASELLAAVERDDDIERGSTALYDGMGLALGHLEASSRPVKLLIVSTDGLENASEGFSKSQILSEIEDNRVIVIMLGSLFSDVDELRDLAGDNGIFVYAADYSVIRDGLDGLVDSLGNWVKITLDDAYQNADSVEVSADGLSTSFNL